MWVRELRIENFRGNKGALIEFGERQTVLVGSNGAGKSTILESFALIFGRDRLVRTLTEHDFHGSNPDAGDRIRMIATITGINWTNLNNPNGTLTSSTFGKITGAGSPRIGQFALRYDF